MPQTIHISIWIKKKKLMCRWNESVFWSRVFVLLSQCDVSRVTKECDNFHFHSLASADATALESFQRWCAGNPCIDSGSAGANGYTFTTYKNVVGLTKLWSWMSWCSVLIVKVWTEQSRPTGQQPKLSFSLTFGKFVKRNIVSIVEMPLFECTIF